MTRRSLTIFLLAVFVFSSIGAAQHRHRHGAGRPQAPAAAAEGKIAIDCPSTLNSIQDCPDTGCGPSLDPNLNKQKNIRTKAGTPADKDLKDLASLPDPVPDFAIGDTREKVTALGEGAKIRVVAFALIARTEKQESCNCDLQDPKDTDVHIVLVDQATLRLKAKATPAIAKTATQKAVKAKTAAENTLHLREAQSQTAEFTPRVRLDHPTLVGVDLQALIDAQGGALPVRVTGLQLYDSEHSLGPNHLNRHNNWEIHPVFGLEFCPKGKTCTKGSDANWKSL
jgi:hypothetical protein